MFLRDISFRLKLPLCMMSASAITAVVAIIVVSWAYYSESKKNYIEHNHVLGNSMLNMLTWSLNHKDIWHAYTLLRGRVHNSLKTSNHIFILFDEQQTIFASNQPAQFPTATHIADLQTVSYSLLDGLKRILGTQQASNLSIEQHMISSFPLISDDIVIGHLVIAESYNSITGMLNNISRQGLIAIFITIGFLTPIAWFWGRRIVNPLLQLDACILKIGKEPLDNIQCLVPNDKDEIGRLSQHFKIMVNDLKKKSDMEKQIVRSDRLAAVGTLAAGVAHEINNPLAGMVMAVDTYKRYCTSAECMQQDNAIASIELVERGLTQIQETVSALLVNVNTNDKPLTRIDVEDTIKLVMPKCSTKSITINWKNDIQDTINIPSASIRQILINLLLNAIHAAGHDGHVDCLVRIENNSLLLTVKNDGDPIPEDQIEHLFEPFFSMKDYGAGLGLWVTYQIVQTLKGNIAVNSENQLTTFEVTIPRTSKDLIK
jgi:signal transduction histidine kinase